LCLCGAGSAYALEPRKHVSLLGDRNLAALVPYRFGAYSSRDVSDLVAPREDSLASHLYGQTVGRIYTTAADSSSIMMLLAHGDTQNDDLQLHRPEVCYRFFGYAVEGLRTLEMPMGGGVTLPCRTLVAQAPDRRETIVYWSRLGEFLPLDHRQQQIDRLATALHGQIADGLLSRFSIADIDPAAAVSAMSTFIPQMIRAVPPSGRGVLIGSARAAALHAAGV
jgi:EpsI family protein